LVTAFPHFGTRLGCLPVCLRFVCLTHYHYILGYAARARRHPAPHTPHVYTLPLFAQLCPVPLLIWFRCYSRSFILRVYVALYPLPFTFVTRSLFVCFDYPTRFAFPLLPTFALLFYRVAFTAFTLHLLRHVTLPLPVASRSSGYVGFPTLVLPAYLPDVPRFGCTRLGSSGSAARTGSPYMPTYSLPATHMRTPQLHNTPHPHTFHILHTYLPPPHVYTHTHVGCRLVWLLRSARV